MITFFTMPKPFDGGHIDMIQRNAIASWTRLGPEVRVVLMGDEPGVPEAARDLGVDHLPIVQRNRYGTPLLGGLFDAIEQHDDALYFNYINTDIIVMSDFMEAFRAVVRRKRRMLMVGRRTNFDQREPLDFAPGWEDRLRAAALGHGQLQGPPWIDYFVYRRGVWGELPPFAVGRFTWDNWMIYRARQLQVPVIDASECVLAVHQNHNYGHAGGRRNAQFGREAKQNLELAGGNKHLFTIWDASHALTRDGLRRRQADPGTLGGGIWTYRRSIRFGAA